MNFFNNRFLPVMKKTIKKLREDETRETFSTVELIQEYIGHYQVDKLPASYSINANIGKFLKANAKALRIKEKRPQKSVTYAKGKRTKSSIWEFI